MGHQFRDRKHFLVSEFYAVERNYRIPSNKSPTITIPLQEILPAPFETLYYYEKITAHHGYYAGVMSAILNPLQSGEGEGEYGKQNRVLIRIANLDPVPNSGGQNFPLTEGQA